MNGARAHTLPPSNTSPLRAAPWHFQSDGVRWRCFDLDNAELRERSNLLSSEEHARAARFRFEIDRDRYIAAHVALRISLGEVIKQAPDQIVFSIGEHGKPDLPDIGAWTTFNMSHSGNIGIIAVAPRDSFGAIGVDVERVTPIDELLSLARENFTSEEYDALAKAADDDALRLFLRCWTRKEACLKALGTGLTLPANIFTAGLNSDTAKVSIDIEGKPQHLRVRTLFENETCIAALSWRQASGTYADAGPQKSSTGRPAQELRTSSWI